MHPAYMPEVATIFCLVQDQVVDECLPAHQQAVERQEEMVLGLVETAVDLDVEIEVEMAVSAALDGADSVAMVYFQVDLEVVEDQVVLVVFPAIATHACIAK